MKRYGDRVKAYHSNYWTDPAQLIGVQKSGGQIINQTRGDKSINRPGGTNAIPAKNFDFRKIIVDQSKKQVGTLESARKLPL